MPDISRAMYELQLFLRTPDLGPEALERFHGIRFKVDSAGELIILDYDATNPALDWSNPYAHVCRGLVLDAKTYDVVGFGLPKFFNIDEPCADRIDWQSAVTLEKLDGTMVQRFRHNGEWKYSTRFQLPEDIETNLVVPGLTWRQLIDRAVADVDFCQDEDETLVMEVVSPFNMQVVRQKAYGAFEIMRRNNRTWVEGLPRASHQVRAFLALASEDSVRASVQTLDGTICEGYVIVDKHRHRVKVKSPQYVMLHHLKDAVSAPKNLLLAYKKGEADEVRANLPEFNEALDLIDGAFKAVAKQHQEVFDRLKDRCQTRKDFAIAVKQESIEMPSVLFSALTSGLTIEAELLGLKDSAFVDHFRPKVDWVAAMTPKEAV
jgi:hypothetical protein